MGEPLRRDPAPGEPSSSGRQFNIHRYGNPNRGSSWRWIFLLLVIAVIVWFVIWGRGGSRNPQTAATAPANPAPTTAQPAPQPTIDVPTLLSSTSNYIGKDVRLRDVLIQSVNGTSSVFVGPKNSQVLVVLQEGAVPDTLQGQPRSLPQGGVVTITGQAEKPGSTRDLERSAKISRKEAEQVQKDGVIINATRVQPQRM